jgi:hypothetical protein
MPQKVAPQGGQWVKHRDTTLSIAQVLTGECWSPPVTPTRRKQDSFSSDPDKTIGQIQEAENYKKRLPLSHGYLY